MLTLGAYNFWSAAILAACLPAVIVVVNIPIIITASYRYDNLAPWSQKYLSGVAME